MKPTVMDTNIPTPTIPQPVRPMNEPHIPVTERETMENPHHTSAKYVFFTLFAFLILAVIVGITLYLYIKNGNKSVDQNTTDQASQQDSNLSSITPWTKEQLNQKYGDVICRRFTNLIEALEAVEIACVLDLSNQNLSTVPKEITLISNLAELNLSNNQITNIPIEVFQLKKLTVVDLSNNKISYIPENFTTPANVQVLILTGNPLPQNQIQKYQKLPQ